MTGQENQKIGFFDRIIYSVQPDKYKELIRQPLKSAVRYLVMLAFCLTIMDYAVPAAGWVVSFGGFDNLITKVLPKIEFADGMLKVGEPIEIGREGSVHLLVDTSRDKVEVNELHTDKYAGEFLVAKKNMALYNTYVGAAEIDFTQYKGIRFDNQTLLGIKPWIYSMLVMSFFSTMVAEIFRYLMSAFLLAFVGCMMGGTRSRGKLKFSKVFVMTLYAKTASALLVSFVVTAGLMQNQVAISYGGIFATVFFVVAGIRKAEEELQ